MTAERVRAQLKRAPFAPLTLHLSDGRFFHVDHPDYATVLRDSRTISIESDAGRIAFVDLDSVISLQTVLLPDES